MRIKSLIIFLGLIITLIISYIYITPLERGGIEVDPVKIRTQAPKEEMSIPRPKRSTYPDRISLRHVEEKAALQVNRQINPDDFTGKNILALGDSLTEGIGDIFTSGGFISALDQAINEHEKVASFQNYGKLGIQTSHLLKQVQRQHVKEAIKLADLIIIAIGANDIIKVFRDHFPELSLEVFTDEQVHYEERLFHSLKDIERINPHTEIYFIGLYNPFEHFTIEIPELDDIIKDWNEGSQSVTSFFEQVTFVPIMDVFSGQYNLFSEDQFHPSRLGYVKIAERIIDFITKEGD